MVLADLVRDLERGRTRKHGSEAWKCVLEQMPLRKKWPKTSPGKKNPNDMDLDQAEHAGEEEAPDDEDNQEEDLHLIKGAGKRDLVCKGTVSIARRRGHTWADCRKRLADEKGGEGGGNSSKGDKGSKGDSNGKR